MFAMTSGTTGEPKRVPDHRGAFPRIQSGWFIWARRSLRRLSQPRAKKSLQLSSDWQQYRARAACPAVKSAAWQPARGRGLASSCFCRRPRRRRFTTRPPSIMQRCVSRSRRRILGSIMTANPSSLVEFARRANQDCEVAGARYPRRNAVVRRAVRDVRTITWPVDR